MARQLQIGRQRLLVAHPDADYVARIGKQFRQLGWEVHSAASEGDIRRVTRAVSPAVLVLATDFPAESGWLICAKLTREHPGLQVILVGNSMTPDQVRFGAFAGGKALLEQAHGMRALIEEVYRAADLPMVG